MPRYFFHVADGCDYPDLQGTELANLSAARQEALRFTGMLLSEKSESFWSGEEWVMRIADAHDLTLFTLTCLANDAPAVGGSKNAV
ncbi:MAG TPA: hypothetical protein VF637_05020 [Sphingomicrobium sp.]